MKSRLLISTLILSMGGLFFSQTSVSAETIIKFSHNMPQKKTATYHRYFLLFQEPPNQLGQLKAILGPTLHVLIHFYY